MGRIGPYSSNCPLHYHDDDDADDGIFGDDDVEDDNDDNNDDVDDGGGISSSLSTRVISFARWEWGAPSHTAYVEERNHPYCYYYQFV